MLLQSTRGFCVLIGGLAIIRVRHRVISSRSDEPPRSVSFKVELHAAISYFLPGPFQPFELACSFAVVGTLLGAPSFRSNGTLSMERSVKIERGDR